jgi:hypothetical protein
MANGFDLGKLFEGSLRRLQTEAEYFSRLTEHNPELGRLNETHLIKLLREYLPPKSPSEKFGFMTRRLRQQAA